MSNPRLSPDGKRILLQITDATADGARSHLWLVDVDGGAQRQLTFSSDGDKAGERSGEWMPDGQSILFTAHRGEHTSLFQLPMAGGEALRFDLKVMPLVDASRSPDVIPPRAPDAKTDARDEKPEPLAVDISGFRIAPDGKTVAVLVRDPETPGEKKQKDGKADAAWVDHDLHGTRAYLLNVASSKLTLVAIPPEVRGVSWSPDSARMVALEQGVNGADDLGPTGSVWMVAASDLAHPVRIPEMPMTVGAITWAADGQTLVIEAQAKADAPPGYGDLYEFNLTTKTLKNLTENFSGSVGRAEPVAVKGGGVVGLTDQGLDITVARFSGSHASPEAIKLPVAAVTAIATNAAQNGWIFLGSDGNHPPALYYSAKLSSAAHLVATPALVPDNLTAVAGKRIEWKSDAFTMQGMLYLPPGATVGKVPLVVEVHGGPLGSYSDIYAPFTNFLLGRGWAVLHTNPRGSTGRGASFAAANKNDLGGGDYRDIMAGVESVLRTEPIDPARMALMGYSYGGEMAGFVEGKTTRFKAIVSGAPVIDQQSEYGTESGSWYDRWYYGRPWEHEADAWRQSPLSGVGQARTPFLLLQGESDSTDPLGQSQEMYRALRQMGVAVELVTYPRDDHGPLSAGIYGGQSREPWHGFDARQRIVNFIGRAFGEPAK